jgi:DNA-directed RNA polymerase subunit RPC12/RpoP
MNNDEKCPVTGKRKYETEGEALATAAHQIASNDAPKDLRAYRCPHCESWHLTKNANKGRRKH